MASFLRNSRVVKFSTRRSYPPCLAASAPTDSRLSVRSVAAHRSLCVSPSSRCRRALESRCAPCGDFLDCTVKVPSLLSLRIGIDPDHYSRTTTPPLWQIPCVSFSPGLWLSYSYHSFQEVWMDASLTVVVAFKSRCLGHLLFKELISQTLDGS